VLDSALARWDYPTDSNGRTRPTRRAATLTERRAALASVKTELLGNWPGDTAARLILDALGQRDAAKAAATLQGKVTRAEEAAAALKVKEAAAQRARHARGLAAKTPAQVRVHISHRLATNPLGWAANGLRQDSATALQAIKEAKARGWTRMGAKLTAHRRMIRAAIADIESRHAIANRQAARRGAIDSIRESMRNVARMDGPESKRLSGDDSAKARAGWQANLSRDAESVLRHCAPVLRPMTIERLRKIESDARAAAAIERAKVEAERFVAEEENRAAWLAGGNVARYVRLSDPTGGALLRAEGVERDESGAITGGTLRTSHGAQVPLDHALKVFSFLRLCRAKGQGWTRNGSSLRVGHFSVDSVTPGGDFVAGCHRINWPEVARLAALLDVESMAARDTTTG